MDNKIKDIWKKHSGGGASYWDKVIREISFPDIVKELLDEAEQRIKNQAKYAFGDYHITTDKVKAIFKQMKRGLK